MHVAPYMSFGSNGAVSADFSSSADFELIVLNFQFC